MGYRSKIIGSFCELQVICRNVVQAGNPKIKKALDAETPNINCAPPSLCNQHIDLAQF